MLTLSDAVKFHLFNTYTDAAGNKFKGQVLSYLQKALREDGFGVSKNTIEATLDKLGFVIIDAVNRRGQTCRVVTVEYKTV